MAGGSIFGVSPNFQWPYSYQLNFSVQRQITKDLSVSAAYVGALSHDLPFATDVNYPILNVPGVTPTTGNVLLRRSIDNPTLGRSPGSAFGQVFAVNSNQGAWYHGLQITANKRRSNHVMLNAFYTYGKALESVQLQNNTTNPIGSGQVPQDYFNLGLERSRTDDDTRHIFNLSGTWQLSYYSVRSSALRGILNLTDGRFRRSSR